MSYKSFISTNLTDIHSNNLTNESFLSTNFSETFSNVSGLILDLNSTASNKTVQVIRIIKKSLLNPFVYGAGGMFG